MYYITRGLFFIIYINIVHEIQFTSIISNKINFLRDDLGTLLTVFWKIVETIAFVSRAIFLPALEGCIPGDVLGDCPGCVLNKNFDYLEKNDRL